LHLTDETATAHSKTAQPPCDAAADGLQSRRSFMTLGFGVWLVFFVWLGGIGALLLRFMFPNARYETEPQFSAGRKADFPETPKVYESFKPAQGVWLVRLTEDGQDRLVALAAVCTHLGCTPNWLEAEQKFKCPCHGSGYHSDGVNFEGPTPRPLERCRIFLDGAGRVVVDKSRTFRKDLGQWNDRESYVLMT
jgi:cytochrome b6-f complex iron-sulfur subunit